MRSSSGVMATFNQSDSAFGIVGKLMPDEFDEDDATEAPVEEEDELSIGSLVRMPEDKFQEALKQLSPDQQTQAKDARIEVGRAEIDPRP